MGVRNDSVDDQIMSEREERTGQAEPLFTVEMELQPFGTGDCLRHTTPARAREIMDLSADDAVKIDVYEHGYFVRKA